MANCTVSSKKDFLSKSQETREQINLEFDRLIDQINSRRNELLLRLEQAVSRYSRVSRESEEAFSKLEELKQSSRDILNLNLLSEIQGRVLSGLDSEIEGMRREVSDLDVSFEWNDIEEVVADLGTLSINNDRIGSNNPLVKIDYASRKPPICKRINLASSDYILRCVCIDYNTSRLYLSTYNAISGILVYSQEGDFMFEYGTYDMQVANGIAIHNDTMYVSQVNSNLILKFRLRNEGLPKRIITLNDYQNQLKCAGKLAIDESNGHVYVCDAGNDKIVRFNKFLGYHSYISGKDIFSPVDLKITQTRLVILAKEPNAYPIRFYCKESSKLLSCLSFEFVPNNFDIDFEENILISNAMNTEISIFNPKGKLLHTIKSSYVCLFASNKINGRIFVFGGNSNILIF